MHMDNKGAPAAPHAAGGALNAPAPLCADLRASLGQSCGDAQP